jgi:hypothetical protein
VTGETRGRKRRVVGTTTNASLSNTATTSSTVEGILREEKACLCGGWITQEETRLVVMCDGCGRWYHGDCVQVDTDAVEFIDKYYCPSCIAKGYQSSWKRECRRIDCSRAARFNSKFCSDECGILVAMRRIYAQTDSTDTMDDIEQDAQTALEEQRRLIQARIECVERRLTRLNERIQSVSDTPDICCFVDNVVLDSDDEWEDPKLEQERSTQQPCTEPRKSCRKHQGWIELKRADLLKELQIEQHQALVVDQKLEQLQQIRQERKGLDLFVKHTHQIVDDPDMNTDPISIV